MGTNLVINQAMETIKFNMNNKGVKLKSEAAVIINHLPLYYLNFLAQALMYYLSASLKTLLNDLRVTVAKTLHKALDCFVLYIRSN